MHTELLMHKAGIMEPEPLCVLPLPLSVATAYAAPPGLHSVAAASHLQ